MRCPPIQEATYQWLKCRIGRCHLEQRLGISASDLPRAQPSVEKRLLPCTGRQAADGAARPRLGAIYLLQGPDTGSEQVATAASAASSATAAWMVGWLADGTGQVAATCSKPSQ